jgi:biopolymer transport protein TolQ
MKEVAYDPISNVFCAAMTEWIRFSSGKLKNSSGTGARSVEQRVERIMQIAIRKEIDELERGLGFLSSLGTNGVIIGLFGTVIGILNGFKAIALQQSTNIATVAPIISEALFTTALGIIAAIPAALGYNKFMNDTNRYINRLETFADELSSIISRQFDE